MSKLYQLPNTQQSWRLQKLHKDITSLANVDTGPDPLTGNSDGISPEAAEDSGIPTWEDSFAAIKNLPPERRELSARQKTANANRQIAEHLGRVTKQVIDPSYFK